MNSLLFSLPPTIPPLFPPLTKPLNPRIQRTLATSPFAKTVVFDSYTGPVSIRSKNQGLPISRKRAWKSLGSCLVVPPPKGVTKPRGIIKFLGGAFIGAIPEVIYGFLIELLAREGFIILSVPYNVTFDHEQAAEDVYQRYCAGLDMILESGLPDFGFEPGELADLPFYSVGHSNGALLQALTGSYFSDKIPEANVIISFNNRPATEAVPYFEQLGPLVSQIMPIVESTPLYGMTRIASDVGLNSFTDMAVEMVSNGDPEAFASLAKFLDQLPGVLNQVRQGISEFKPKPSENRDFFRQSYNVRRTLLIKFNFDTIDETDLLEESLRPRVEILGGTIEKITLNGTHLTPCLQEQGWRAGYVYTPADAVAQGLNMLLLNDVKELARTVSRWL
ncbi:hypothetical protein AKJ16_DCAP15204 [Drosera capensis]